MCEILPIFLHDFRLSCANGGICDYRSFALCSLHILRYLVAGGRQGFLSIDAHCQGSIILLEVTYVFLLELRNNVLHVTFWTIGNNHFGCEFGVSQAVLRFFSKGTVGGDWLEGGQGGLLVYV
jgi:hypothetical protein